jgi:acetyltransferase-like isoleucine patch superfamily enzyme
MEPTRGFRGGRLYGPGRSRRGERDPSDFNELRLAAVRIVSAVRGIVHPRGRFSASVQVARPGALTIGHRTYAARTALVKTWAPSERIEIGSYCSIAGEVRIVHPGESESFVDSLGRPVRLRLRGNHRLDTATTYPIGIMLGELTFDRLPPDGSVGSRPLVIGSDVWIGYRATVLGPVSIGHGAVVGAGAVVAQDVPPYAIVAGNPARVLRSRFDPEVVERLLRIAWWEWEEGRIVANGEWFLRPATEFVEQFDPVTRSL